VASLGATLKILDLGDNDLMQLDVAAVSEVLACAQLRTLGMSNGTIYNWRDEFEHRVWRASSDRMAQQGFIPAQLSLQTVQYTLELTSGFRCQHGRELKVVVNDEVWEMMRP